MRGPAGTVRKLTQADKVAIGWLTAKNEVMKAPSMLQMPGDWAREENVHLQGGQGEPVLQARWHRAPSQGMYSSEPEMPALRGALLLLAMPPHPYRQKSIGRRTFDWHKRTSGRVRGCTGADNSQEAHGALPLDAWEVHRGVLFGKCPTLLCRCWCSSKK
jgi:hypothetical protein